MIWLSLKVSECSGMLSARYTPGTARLSEFDLTSPQMLCRYPSWAKFCILRYSHISWSESAQAWSKRGREGMAVSAELAGCAAQPRRLEVALASQKMGERGEHPFNTVTMYSLLIKHRERQCSSISNDKAAVKKNFCARLLLKQRMSKQPAVLFCVNV